MPIFDLTDRPDTRLFFRRDEAGDPRLGEIVTYQLTDYIASPVVLLGCPQDEGVRRNGGRIGAAAAPDAIRACLYRLVAPAKIRLFDLGNTRIGDTLEETHKRQRELIEKLLRDGKVVISLGGGNDIAYPDCAALSAVTGGDLLALNIDAHLDVRASSIPHSGTPYRQLLDGGHLAGSRFHETAYQPFAAAQSHLDYLAAKGAHAHPRSVIRARGTTPFYAELLSKSEASAIFWGVDMDAVRASDAPGVSAPNPAGLRADDLLAIAQIAGTDSRSRVFEITELNPTYDTDQQTARLAAAAIWTFLNAVY